MYQLLVTNTLVLLADSWICQSAHFRCFFTCASPRPVQSGAREKRLALRSSPALSVRPATRCETGASAEGERTAQSHPQVRTALLLTLDVCEETRDAAKMHALCEEEDDADAETHTCTAVQTRARLFDEHWCFALLWYLYGVSRARCFSHANLCARLIAAKKGVYEALKTHEASDRNHIDRTALTGR